MTSIDENVEEEHEEVAEAELKVQAHANYFAMVSALLPSHYTSLDPSRISAMYFVVVALDLLDSLDTINKEHFTTNIYQLQLHPERFNGTSEEAKKINREEAIRRGHFGFIGGNFSASVNSVFHIESGLMDFGGEVAIQSSCEKYCELQQGHIAMIYTALCSLITLGDDLSQVNKDNIYDGLKMLQHEDGSFLPYIFEGESGDVRFVYCATAIAAMLNIWDAIDIEKTTSFVLSCMTYEGGFGLRPGCEAQGGATYCALAALSMMKKIPSLSDESRNLIISWCERRQVTGYQGRTNKEADSCYAFWVGASLKLLGCFDCTDFNSTRQFLLSQCQYPAGGFAKYPGSYPDILHSYYSLCWLSLSNSLKELDPDLAICADKVTAWNKSSPN